MQPQKDDSLGKKFPEQSEEKPMTAAEGAPDSGSDTSPPPEPTTSKISRVPTREELHLMIKYMDRNRIEPILFGLDDLTKELKVLSDKVKSLEENKK
jgi:hypothetical protein